MGTCAERYDVLTKYCFGHTCKTCPMNDPSLFCSDDDPDNLCILSYAQESLSSQPAEGIIP